MLNAAIRSTPSCCRRRLCENSAIKKQSRQEQEVGQLVLATVRALDHLRMPQIVSQHLLTAHYEQQFSFISKGEEN